MTQTNKQTTKNLIWSRNKLIHSSVLRYAQFFYMALNYSKCTLLSLADIFCLIFFMLLLCHCIWISLIRTFTIKGIWSSFLMGFTLHSHILCNCILSHSLALCLFSSLLLTFILCAVFGFCLCTIYFCYKKYLLNNFTFYWKSYIQLDERKNELTTQRVKEKESNRETNTSPSILQSCDDDGAIWVSVRMHLLQIHFMYLVWFMWLSQSFCTVFQWKIFSLLLKVEKRNEKLCLKVVQNLYFKSDKSSDFVFIFNLIFVRCGKKFSLALLWQRH